MKLHLIKEFEETTDEKETVRDAPPAGDLGQYITSAQAARILNVSMSRVRQFVQEKRLKSYNPVPGRRDNLFKRADVEQFDKKPRERTGRPDEGKGTSKEKKED